MDFSARHYLDKWALGLGVRIASRIGTPHDVVKYSKVKRFLSKYRVKIVLAEFLDQFVEFVPLLDQMRIPYIAQAHGIGVSQSLRNPVICRKFLAYRSARAILTRSELHRKRLINLGLPSKIVHVNHGGVNIPDLMPNRSPESNSRLLAVCRMDVKKEPIYMLKAFRLAANMLPGITLDVVGGGPLLPACQQFVEALQFTAQVRFHGYAQDTLRDRLYRECSIFIQHSITNPDTGDEEGLPAAIQEAMANGMAVVSTRHSGIPEAVKEGDTGFLVEEKDVQGMAQAIIKATKCASRFGSSAYLQARTYHSWDCEKERLLKWLDYERRL